MTSSLSSSGINFVSIFDHMDT